jgi:hypothetical protein
MDRKVVPSKSIFPLFVVGRKSGRTIKWWYCRRLYICGVVEWIPKSWSNVPNGQLCRVYAVGMDSVSTGAPRLTITTVEQLSDQKISIREILDNSNPTTTFVVGRKDRCGILIVAQLERDMPFHVGFPSSASSRRHFSEALPGQKIEITVSPFTTVASSFITSSTCRIIEEEHDESESEQKKIKPRTKPHSSRPSPDFLDRLRSRILSQNFLFDLQPTHHAFKFRKDDGPD